MSTGWVDCVCAWVVWGGWSGSRDWWLVGWRVSFWHVLKCDGGGGGVGLMLKVDMHMHLHA